MIYESDDVILHPLEAADRHAELLASLTVLDGHLEDGLATAYLVRAQYRQRPFHRARQGGPPFVLATAEHRARGNLDVVELDFRLPAHEAGQVAGADPLRQLVDDDEADRVGSGAAPDGDDQVSSRDRVTDQ